jgi:hypothetical protein
MVRCIRMKRPKQSITYLFSTLVHSSGEELWLPRGQTLRCFRSEGFRHRLVWTLNFNKHGNTFILFDKKISCLELIRLNKFVS